MGFHSASWSRGNLVCVSADDPAGQTHAAAAMGELRSAVIEIVLVKTFA